MSENLRKLIGVAVMAAIVVVGVVATNGDDSDFARTRNTAFGLPKGAGLDAQIQQPGDAENDLVIAMAAAAKCDEGHVLISTGDPVSPWRCGPLLSEMATNRELQEVAESPFGVRVPIRDGLDRPCYFVRLMTSGVMTRESGARAMYSCLNQWAMGRRAFVVERVLDDWDSVWNYYNYEDPCGFLFRDMTVETRGHTVTRLNHSLRPGACGED